MKWKVSDVSAAEVIGTTVVVLSLIFVAVEVRESNRETRAATIQSAWVAEMEMIAIMTENAGTWEKVVAGIPLAEGEEMRKGILLYNLVMIEAEARYHQFNAGYLDAESWEGRMPAIQMLMISPVHEIWRSSPGARAHSASFLELLDNLTEESSGE